MKKEKLMYIITFYKNFESSHLHKSCKLYRDLFYIIVVKKSYIAIRACNRKMLEIPSLMMKLTILLKAT